MSTDEQRSGDEWLGLQGAARLLKMPRATIERWARQELFPVRKSESGLEVERAALEAWALKSGMTLGVVPPAPIIEDDLLAASLERGGYASGVAAKSSSEAIEAALGSLDVDAETRGELLDDALERERLMSTGVGRGVAVPHTPKPVGRVREPIVSALFLAEPIDWAALDGKPVHSVFLVVSPDAPRHLDLLSRAAHALRQPGFVDFLREKPPRSTLIERLRAIHASR